MKVKIIMIHLLRNDDLRYILNFCMQLFRMFSRDQLVLQPMYEHDRASNIFHPLKVVKPLSNYEFANLPKPAKSMDHILYRFKRTHQDQKGGVSLCCHISCRAGSDGPSKDNDVFFLEPVLRGDKVIDPQCIVKD